jgi:signal transduction histidine kinase
VNEVSSKAFALFFKALQQKSLPPEVMVEGTDVTVAKLRNKHERVDWSDLLVVMRNLRPHFTDEEFVEIGRQHLRNPMLRFVFIVGRLRFTPMGFFRWFNDPVKGPGNQMFSCITPITRDLSDTELEVDLLVDDGLEVCRDFFTITMGNFIEMPRLLGYPIAKVSLSQLPRGGRFHITVPTKTSALTAVRRTLLFPFAARNVGRELQDAHESLQTRYREIEVANTVVDHQRRLLDTAYQVGQQIWTDRDPTTAVMTIAQSLVSVAGFSGAAVAAAPNEAPESVERSTIGVLGHDRLRLDLGGTGRLSGHIEVSPREGSDPGETRKLLDLLAPTIAIALDNAFAYRALADYQKGLEAKVELRTVELRNAVDQLREAQRARERFFGNISHEIRTPLTLILLAVRDIEARAGRMLDTRSSQNLGSVRDASQKLVLLVDELLLLAAGQEGKLRLHREPTDLVALVAKLVVAWRLACEAAGLELGVLTSPEIVVSLDPVAFERVASNLISNAVKYTPRGGRVELELAVGTEIVFSVRDTGPGISDELAVRLFGRFERGANEHTKGTGIGLALVKQLVEAHDGTIEAIRRTPHGTEMRVTIPLVVAVARAATRELTIHTGHVASSEVHSGQRFVPEGRSLGTIVLAEDNPDLARATAEVLSQRYVVIVGLDGQAALELVRAHQPQLLVTDIEMPRMNGLELAKAFREAVGDQLAPIIMLSAVIDLGTRLAGLEAGAIDYVTKPFEPRELMARVDAQFRMRELAVRLQQAEQMSSLGILTAGLAHELRNPANGIVNAIAPLMELLPRELIGPDTGPGQLLEVMAACATQIGFLSKQLLGFRSGMQLEVSQTSFVGVVRHAVGLSHSALGGVELRIQCTADALVSCSVPLMVQALTNLIENAGHAAGRSGWVQVSTWVQDGRVAVEVTDSGPGVAASLRERIFQPFFTTKAPGQGNGLGLAIARAIVQRHQGILEVRDKPSGSAFVIELPSSDSYAQASSGRYAQPLTQS